MLVGMRVRDSGMSELLSRYGPWNRFGCSLSVGCGMRLMYCSPTTERSATTAVADFGTRLVVQSSRLRWTVMPCGRRSMAPTLPICTPR